MKLVDPQAIYGLWLRDTKRFLRSPSRIVGSLAMPLLFLVFMGFGFQGAAIPDSPRMSTICSTSCPGSSASRCCSGPRSPASQFWRIRMSAS